MSATDQSNITIEPLQVWDIGPGDPKPLRRIKILAKYPVDNNHDYWIYEEMGGTMFKHGTGRLGLFPEFNLLFMHDKGMAVLCQ